LLRVPRTELQYGTRERVSFAGAFQFIPCDDLVINLNILGAMLDSDTNRHNIDIEIRSQNQLIPYDTVIGSNNTLQSIRLDHVNRRSENKDFTQDTEQLHIFLSSTWWLNDTLNLAV